MITESPDFSRGEFVKVDSYHIQLANNGDSYTVNQGERVICGSDSDTITIGEGVTSFTLEGFGAGDKIEGVTGDILTTVNGGIKVGDVTINGLTKNSTEYAWTVEGGVKYQTWETGGVSLDGTKINYIESTTANKTNVFALDGLKSGLKTAQLEAAIDISGKKITIKDARVCW